MADIEYGRNEEITCMSLKENPGVVSQKNREDISFHEGLLSEIREILSAKVELSKFMGRGSFAEREMNEMQYELREARKEAKELASKIKEVGAKSLKHKLKLLEMDSCKRNQDESLLVLDESVHHQYLQVLGELDDVKQQVSSLTLDLSSARRAKIKAVADVQSDANCIDELMETERAKNKQVFVDLNRLNNNSELGELEAHGEFELLLQSSKHELEEAKKQLSILEQEKFRLMKVIDVLRQEMNQIIEEKANSSTISEVSESHLPSLNMKLHVAMSKLESASNAEKRAQTIVLNLSAALEQLKNDVSEAKQDLELTVEEIKAINRQTEQFNLQTASMHERLETAMEELKAAKESEAFALENLRMVTENTMTERAISAMFSNTVTISKFEYLYLSREGKAAKDVAELKVAAAKTWLKALKAETKERYLRLQIAQKRAKWPLVPYEQKKRLLPAKVLSLKKPKKQLLIGYTQDEEFMKSLNLKLAIAMPRRSLTVSGLSGSGRAKTRRSSVSSRRRPSLCSPSSSPPHLNDAPKKGVSNLVKLFRPPLRCRKQQYSSVGASSAWLY